MRLDPNISVTIFIHLIDEFMEAYERWLLANPNPKPGAASEMFKRFESRVGRLRNVEEVCTDHQVWVKLEPTARTWEGVQAEVARTKAKALAILARTVG